MRFILTAISVLSSWMSFAQSDDYPDYRSKKDFFIRVREKDVRSDLASFTTAGIDESMGKLPLKTISLKELGTNILLFEGDNIKVVVKTIPFKPAEHKLGYYEENKYVLKIDAKPFYGNYSKMPQNSIASVTVTIDNDTVAIPPAAYADIYDPVFSYKDASGTQRSLNRVYRSADKRNIYIYLLNRTAGGTEVTWVIQDKKYLRRVLDFGFLK
ncbi:MAG: hypothetical protein H7Y03_12545 [Chitinophagaceae bacterium]|nr:hypothetical protein [Chitinophagaceae bacterium]